MCGLGILEAQVLVLRLKSDLYEVLAACAAGRLEEVELQWDPAAAVCVVLAAPGYPGEYPKEIPLEIRRCRTTRWCFTWALSAAAASYSAAAGGC